MAHRRDRCTIPGMAAFDETRGFGRVQTGIRAIDPAAAERLRARILRDAWWYQRLTTRMGRWFLRDTATQRMIERAGRSQHALLSLSWAADTAGKPDERDLVADADAWAGDGI